MPVEQQYRYYKEEKKMKARRPQGLVRTVWAG
jgi:hypothetical protein